MYWMLLESKDAYSVLVRVRRGDSLVCLITKALLNCVILVWSYLFNLMVYIYVLLNCQSFNWNVSHNHNSVIRATVILHNFLKYCFVDSRLARTYISHQSPHFVIATSVDAPCVYFYRSVWYRHCAQGSDIKNKHMNSDLTVTCLSINPMVTPENPMVTKKPFSTILTNS